MCKKRLSSVEADGQYVRKKNGCCSMMSLPRIRHRSFLRYLTYDLVFCGAEDIW